MIEIAHGGDWILVLLDGEIDMARAPAIGDRLAELQRLGYRQIRVDLARVTFLDSQGLNMLCGAYKSAARLGGTLEVVNAGSAVRNVFELTSLHRLLDGADRDPAA